jgi:hypothetical protein
MICYLPVLLCRVSISASRSEKSVFFFLTDDRIIHRAHVTRSPCTRPSIRRCWRCVMCGGGTGAPGTPLRIVATEKIKIIITVPEMPDIDFAKINQTTKEHAHELLEFGETFMKLVQDPATQSKVVHLACEPWRLLLKRDGINIHSMNFADTIKDNFTCGAVKVKQIRNKKEHGKSYSANAFVFSGHGILPQTVDELCSLMHMGNESKRVVSNCLCICLIFCLYIYITISFRSITILTEVLSR